MGVVNEAVLWSARRKCSSRLVKKNVMVRVGYLLGISPLICDLVFLVNELLDLKLQLFDPFDVPGSQRIIHMTLGVEKRPSVPAKQEYLGEYLDTSYSLMSFMFSLSTVFPRKDSSARMTFGQLYFSL